MNRLHTFLLILLALFFGYNAKAQDITLTTQTEVDAFDQNINNITGYLNIIASTASIDPITNLNALSNLTSIGGFLRISNNDELNQIDGLTNLTSIGGTLAIRSNPTLSQIDGLSNLRTVGGDLDISNNDALSQIDGLSKVTSIEERLAILSNPMLSQINGLASVKTIGDDLLISDNLNLTQLDGLSSLTTIGGVLSIIGNDLLSHLDGLANLTSFTGKLDISNNNALMQIDGLLNLTSIRGNLTIESNHLLEQIDGLSNVASIDGYLRIRKNDELAQIDDLTNLTTIGGTLSITSNPTLSQINGLSNLRTVGGDLGISYNDALSQIEGLSKLTSIEKGLAIQSNPMLSQINGLASVITIGDALHISNNLSLTQLDGLSSLMSVGGALSIIGNDLLAQLDGVSNLTSFRGYLDISNNNALIQIDGLSNLTSIRGNLTIESNHLLEQIDGLSNVASIDGNVLISANNELSQINGLSKINTVKGDLIIKDNNALIHLDGLANLNAVSAYLRISNNAALSQIDGLANLNSIGGKLGIDHNETLSQVDGLSNLTAIGGDLVISVNNSLLHLDGLSSVTSIGEYVGIVFNPLLSQIDGLISLTSLNDGLTIDANVALRHLDGLSNLESIKGNVSIDANQELTQLEGLSNLASVSGDLGLWSNISLINVDGLSNLISIGGDLLVVNNHVLIDCCGLQNLLLTPGSIGGSIEILDNPSECSSPSQVINKSCSFLYVYNDIDANCIKDNELGIRNRRALIEPGNLVVRTNNVGRLNINFLSIGNYKITVDTFGPWITNCPTSYEFEVVHPDTLPVMESFGLTATDPCPMPSISVHMPTARRCFQHQRIYVEACNQATATGQITDGMVTLTLDSILIFQKASITFETIHPYQYRFDIGDLNPGNCINFWVDVMVSCDAVLGQNLCIKAELIPIVYCIYQISSPVVNSSSTCSTPYDNSELSLSGSCQNDIINFKIINSGADMSCHAPVRFFADGVFESIDSVQLMADESTSIQINADGRTWRMEVDQHPDYIRFSKPNVTVERCGDINEWTAGLVGTRYLDDLDPHVDIFCTQVRGSFDPNDKTGYPVGVTEDHFVLPNQKMEYLIRFQNTGTDTAFTVVIRDTLDTDFDIFTVQSTVASHAYTFQLYGPRVLEWTFSDILLPDSTTNEAASHGFVTFEVHQHPNLDNQTKLTNTAAIYFDFNEPIFTNETEHIVNDGIQQISSTTNLQGLSNKIFELFPNPTSGNLYIDLKETYQDIHVDLYSILGQQIKHEEFKFNDLLNITMDVSAGVYFIIVTVDDGYREVFRVMKE